MKIGPKSEISSHIHESECDIVKYFTSRLINFHEPEVSEIKPKSEISSHITLMSVISGLFYTRYLHCCSSGLELETQSLKLVVGTTHTPSIYFSSCYTPG